MIMIMIDLLWERQLGRSHSSYIAPSYSLITATNSHSDIQLEDESLEEGACVDGGTEIDGDVDMPEGTEVHMLIVLWCVYICNYV